MSRWEAEMAVRRSLDFFFPMLVLNIGIYLVLGIYFERSLFEARLGRQLEEWEDGFAVELRMLEDPDTPTWIHLRSWVVAPFLAVEDREDRSLVQCIIMLAYSLPVVLAKRKAGPRMVLQQLLLFLPILVSFRMAICVYSITYLYISSVWGKGNRVFLTLYAFCSVLSTNVMAVFALNMLYDAFLRSRRSWFKYLFGIACGAVILSVCLTKIIPLYERINTGQYGNLSADVDLALGGDEMLRFVTVLLMDSSLVGGAMSINEFRFVILLCIILLGIGLLVRAVQRKEYRVVVFFAFFFPLILTEGIGPFSFSGPFLLYFLSSWSDLVKHRVPRRPMTLPLMNPIQTAGTVA